MKLLGKIPKEIGIAFSGGVDSVFALDFLSRSKKVTLVHFVHGDAFSELELEFTIQAAKKYDVELLVGYMGDKKRHNKQSQEQYWREWRYQFFHSLKMPIITVHHLDDSVETYIMTCLHGQGRVIPYSNNNVIRPFLLTPKREILNWASTRKLKFLEDPSNLDVNVPRNRVRHKMMKDVLAINPGIHKVVFNKVMRRFEEEKNKDSNVS